MKEEVMCRRCHALLGWYCAYCLSCWGNLSPKKRSEALLSREDLRMARKLRKIYEVD